MKKFLNFFAIPIFVLGLVFSLSACSGNGGDTESLAHPGTQESPIKIGVVNADLGRWTILKSALETDGIYVEYVNFSDYTSENPATSRGELDINQFQHLDYLAGYNVDNNDTLVPIGATAIYPIGLYPNKSDGGVKSISDIKKGDKVVIPNDETNSARALHLLEDNGLIKLNAKLISTNATVQDVDKSNSKVDVTAVDPSETAHSLSDPSVVAAVVNNDFLKDADLEPKDALISESADSDYARRYINIWVTRDADSNNETYKKIVEVASTNKEFLQKIKEEEPNAVLVTEYTETQLKEILSELQKERDGGGE
jgi:D-methionine transport system substrate-binding protein